MPPHPEDILAYLGANLRRLRVRREMTQQDLAEKVGVDVRYLQRVERGKVNIGLVALMRLAGALDVRPGLLLRKADLPAPAPGRPRGRKRKR